MVFFQREGDAEDGAAAEVGGEDDDAAAVVLLDDAAGERKAKAPAAFFGGIAGVEHGFEAIAGYALAGVGHVDECVAAVATESHGYGAVAVDGVDRVFYKIFHNPLEERWRQLDLKRRGTWLQRKGYPARYTGRHVVDRPPDNLVEVYRLHARPRPYLAEARGYHGEPPDILVHLPYRIGIDAERG